MYKDPHRLFVNKKRQIISLIRKSKRTFKSIKFSIGLSIDFYHNKGNNIVSAQQPGDQFTVLRGDSVRALYDIQTAYLERWVENFTNTASGLMIERCVALYLNITRYDPL